MPRWLIPVYSLVLLVLFAGGGWFYVVQRDRLQAAAEQNLDAIARLKVDQIVQWRSERLSDAATLMEGPFSSSALARWVASGRGDGTGQILSLLELSRIMLENLGYTTLTARTPAEAIRLVNEHPEVIHLLITDVVMPQMNGRDLADLIAEMKPGLKILFMSGYTADVIAHQCILEKGVSFVSKPFSMNALAEKVREVLG